MKVKGEFLKEPNGALYSWAGRGANSILVYPSSSQMMLNIMQLAADCVIHFAGNNVRAGAGKPRPRHQAHASDNLTTLCSTDTCCPLRAHPSCLSLRWNRAPLPSLLTPLPYNTYDHHAQQQIRYTAPEPPRWSLTHAYNAGLLPPTCAGRKSTIGASNPQLKNHVQLVAPVPQEQQNLRGTRQPGGACHNAVCRQQRRHRGRSAAHGHPDLG
jgi:hypothetical protein